MRRTRLGHASLLTVLGAALMTACPGTGEPPATSPRTELVRDAAPPDRVAELEAGAPGRARAPFVVAVVVDQLSAWVASSRWPALPASGGFARLMREGTWVKSLRYPYAVTDTAPGHASLQTGRVPAESGIFANEIPDPSTGVHVSIVRDEAEHPVTANGQRPGPGWSASRLRVETVADRLRAAHPEALVVSVSVKDRAAILPGGRRPSHVLWFDAQSDSFVTSTAFAQTYPRWAAGVGDPAAVAAARAKPWALGDPAWVKAHAATPDDAPGEGDLDGLGTTFPHVARSAAAFRATPASDSMVAALGLAAMGAAYDPARPTLLLLSMSASDVIGHVFGPDSWEAWDHLLQLDATLGTVIESLDRRVGAPVTVLLAADHGNISMPEVPPPRAGVSCTDDAYGRPCTTGTRLGPTALTAELNDALKAALGPGRWVAGIADSHVFLTPAARALPEAARARADAAIRAVLARHPAVAELMDARALAAQCPRVLAAAQGIPARARIGEDNLTLVCRSWPPGAGAGDYFVILRPGSFFDGELVVGKGTGHGSPYAYDRTVPMLVRAPQAIEAGAIVEEPVDFAAFAALEAAFLGLDTRAPRDVLAAHRAPPARPPPPRR